MDTTITLAVIVGTTRERRLSIHAAQWIAAFAAAREHVEVIFVDPKDFDLPGDGNDPEGKDPRYTDITRRADAFFIVTPEYNHSFPGSLKRLLDSELETYMHKPVALAGVSNGGWGGVRAVEALVPAIRETGLIVMSWDIYFPRIQDIFDEAGIMRPEHTARYEQNTAKLLNELLWFAQLLKKGRQS